VQPFYMERTRRDDGVVATGLLPAAVAPAVVPSARVPQMAGKSSVRVCLPMRTLLLQTVYTHIKSNDICMLVCMFELGFRPYKKLITRDRGIIIDE
jgi:hypothetical protein